MTGCWLLDLKKKAMKLLERKGIENHMDRLREGRIEASRLVLSYGFCEIYCGFIPISWRSRVSFSQRRVDHQKLRLDFTCLTSTVADRVSYKV